MKTLNKIIIETGLGNLIALADEQSVLMVDFLDCKNIPERIETISKKLILPVENKSNSILDSLVEQITAYFKGTLKNFDLPLQFLGTPFQVKVWRTLTKITFGEQRSYLNLAKKINHPKAFRAVAQANSRNNHVIIVPCHRVINHSGAMGGYSAGLQRKQWLLEHEANFRYYEQGERVWRASSHEEIASY